MELGTYYSMVMSNLMLVLTAFMVSAKEDERQDEAATWARLGPPAGGPPPPAPPEAAPRHARRPRRAPRPRPLPPPGPPRRRRCHLAAAGQGVLLLRARRQLRQPPAVPLGAGGLVRLHGAVGRPLRPALARHAPHRHRAPPLCAPRRSHVRHRHRRRDPCHGATPCARCRRWRCQGRAEAESVRALAWRPHGGHRGKQGQACCRLRRRHVRGGARVQESGGRDRAAARHGEHARPPAGTAALARLGRRTPEAHRAGEPEERADAQSDRCREATAAAEGPRCRRGGAAAGVEEHDRRDALAAGADPQQYTDTFIAALVTNLFSGGGDHVGDHGMGHVAAAQPPGRAAEGARGGERARRPRPAPRQRRPPPPPLPPVHHQRDPAALPRCAAASGARVVRRLQPPRVPCPGGHHAARQRLRHPPGPVRVGRSRGVQAGEVRRQWR
ncbi:hypothetical protein ACQJBY_007315 [Aegilops geniculata]